VVGFAGFDPQLPAQPQSATTALLVVYCGIPALLLAIAATLIWRFPIDARRQAVIAKRLAARDARAARA
jgi:Na+/melibiose symporter-like transporter